MATRWLIITAVTAFFVTAGLGYILIPLLHKLKFGQPIKDIGPVWHKSKQGTPTMGGILFVLGILVSLLIAAFFTEGGRDGFGAEEIVTTFNYRLWNGVGMALLFGLAGFIDDMLKIKRHNNNGLSSTQKLIMQILIASTYLLSNEMSGIGTTKLWIPFAGLFDIGLFYYPLMVFIIISIVNAVNFTDGVDGLCGCVTFVAAAFFALMAGVYSIFGLSLLSMALLGALAGYLIWNFYPGKVMMGDLGSHYLGGLVVALAFYMDKPLLLLPVGIVYFWEMISVVLQILFFKTTGKRIFKMTPIHHSFEMSGWSERKICLIFSAVGIAGAAIAAVLVIYG